MDSDFDELGPARAGTAEVHLAASDGRLCRLIDNTGDAIPATELERLLADLIAHDCFGFRPRTAAGGSTLDLGRPEAAHVQVAGKLYRLLVLHRTARLEPF